MKELFSRRYRDRNGDPELYIYNDFPEAFRNQCFHIIRSFIDFINSINFNRLAHDFTENLCKTYSREKGLKHLYGGCGNYNNINAIEEYVDKSSNEDFLDFLDFFFSNYVCKQETAEKTINQFSLKSNPFQDAIDELNLRFKQHSLGYECTNGEIIPKTNEFIHTEVIKPALKLLTDERFRGVEDEYLTAFEHLKNGNNKDAILNASKAFESAIKVICQNLGYEFSDKNPAKKLVEILKHNDFFPPYLESYLNNLCALLAEGAPVVRNQEGGHGQGAEIKETTDEYVEYVLNTVASNIVFMYKIFKKKEQA